MKRDEPAPAAPLDLSAADGQNADFVNGFNAGLAARLAPAAPLDPVVTLHTCWDNHEGPDGTHADGSPCLDKPMPLYAAPAAPLEPPSHPRPGESAGFDAEVAAMSRAVDKALAQLDALLIYRMKDGGPTRAQLADAIADAYEAEKE